MNGYALTLEADSGSITTVSGVISSGRRDQVWGRRGDPARRQHLYRRDPDRWWKPVIQNSQALGATDGTAATEATLNLGGTLTLDGSFAVSNQLLVLNGGGTLTGTGADVWTGNINFVAPVDSTVNVDGPSLQLSGILSSTTPGENTVYVRGSGVLDLTGDSSLGGGYFWDSGTLQVDGTLTNLLDLIVWEGGRLQGSGTVSSLQDAINIDNGTVEPGGGAAQRLCN